MKEKVIFATGNEDKMKEIRMILADVDVEVLSWGKCHDKSKSLCETDRQGSVSR